MTDEKSTLQSWDDQAAAVQKTPNRVTLEYMESRVVDEEYIRSSVCPELTIAVLKWANGFSIVGKSACADPANYDEALGKKFAREDAMRQMWAFEGFALRERLAAR